MAKSQVAVHLDIGARQAPHHLKILVLDDDEFDRRRIQRILSELAFATEVQEADGLMALQEQLNAHSFDAIFVDYRLSKGDGLDALNTIENHRGNSSAARIMIVGDPHYEVAVQAMKHGCNEFVSKDKLDAKLLQKSILGAILAANQKASTRLNTEIQDLANDIANGTSEVCLVQMRPMLSRILRQTGVLKRHDSALSDQSVGALKVIEQSCRVLTDFLNDFETKVVSATEIASGKIVPLVK